MIAPDSSRELLPSRLTAAASIDADGDSGTRFPLFDVQTYNRLMRASVDEAIQRVLESGHFIGGPECARFEQLFAEYCGASHAVGVASGTDAIVLALRALGIGPGDEVITSSYSFVATAQAIVQVGATPRFVDIDADGYHLDPEKLKEKLTPRTRAILVVHLFGTPADMDEITSFANRHGLAVVEDAAQAHGARYKGQSVGSLGAIGCFSFYPTKNLGALGDGGAIVTQDALLADRVRMLANHDRIGAADYGALGTNSRLDAIQAAGLNVKMLDLPARTSSRQQLSSCYDAMLAGLPAVAPKRYPWADPVTNVYSIRVAEDVRDALMQHLQASGVETRVYYPLPMTRMSGFARYVNSKETFPQSDRASHQSLALPFYPELRSSDVEYIVDRIREFFLRRGS